MSVRTLKKVCLQTTYKNTPSVFPSLYSPFALALFRLHKVAGARGCTGNLDWRYVRTGTPGLPQLLTDATAPGQLGLPDGRKKEKRAIPAGCPAAVDPVSSSGPTGPHLAPDNPRPCAVWGPWLHLGGSWQVRALGSGLAGKPCSSAAQPKFGAAVTCGVSIGESVAAALPPRFGSPCNQLRNQSP